MSFRDTLTSSTVILGSALFGIATSSLSFAQQPPSWSPQPFSKPNIEATSTQTPAIPANSLRASEGQQNQEVLRWGIGNKSVRQPTPEKSYSQALKPQSNDSQVTSHRLAVGTGANPSPKSSEPRSGFDLETRETRSPVALQAASETPQVSLVQLASYAEPAPATPAPEKRTSGVWYDRNSSAESAPAEIATTRKTNVQKAKFQETPFLPPSQTPNLPPSQSSTLPSAGDLLPTLPQSPKGLSLDEQVNGGAPAPLVVPSKPGRSLLGNDEQEIPPSPFPGSKSPKKDDRSPSDNSEPPQINRQRDNDPAPMPPRRKDRSSIDCDAIRASALSTDIKSIRIDSSPSFVEGFKDKGRASQSSKDSVIGNAPSRSWLSFDGELVAEGKLSDLRLGSVIIEKADGTKATYLLHKLSDADQIYVSEQWGLPVTCSIDDRSFPSREFVESTVTWKASGACHKPLYFEDVQLERYGHELGPVVQPVISTARFFGDVVVLPYKMGINPMNECQYSLGYYRPGSCAPWSVGPVPISLRGALMQAKVVTGAALVLP